MKLFTFVGKGKALPANITLIAESITEAMRICNDWVDEKGLDPTTFRLTRMSTFVHGTQQILYSWDGDY